VTPFSHSLVSAAEIATPKLVSLPAVAGVFDLRAETLFAGMCLLPIWSIQMGDARIHYEETRQDVK